MRTHNTSRALTRICPLVCSMPVIGYDGRGTPTMSACCLVDGRAHAFRLANASSNLLFWGGLVYLEGYEGKWSKRSACTFQHQRLVDSIQAEERGEVVLFLFLIRCDKPIERFATSFRRYCCGKTFPNCFKSARGDSTKAARIQLCLPPWAVGSTRSRIVERDKFLSANRLNRYILDTCFRFARCGFK